MAPILGRYQEYDEILSVVGDDPIKMFQARIDRLASDEPLVDASAQEGTGAAGAPTAGDPAAEEPAAEGDAEPMAKATEDYGTSSLPYALQDGRADIIDDASWVYEALLSDGRGKDAKNLMYLITTTFPVNKSFGLFIERAQRLEFWGPSAEIADLGMAVLDERGQRRMQRLLDRIPKEPAKPAPKPDQKKGDK